MEAKAFLHLAMMLAQRPSPAELRTAVSRSYYAAYHKAREVLACLGFPVDEAGQGHHQAYERLMHSGVDAVKCAGSRLGMLQTRRIDADYRLSKVEIENQAMVKSLVGQADEILKVLDTCYEEPNRTTMIRSIQMYLDKIS